MFSQFLLLSLIISNVYLLTPKCLGLFLDYSKFGMSLNVWIWRSDGQKRRPIVMEIFCTESNNVWVMIPTFYYRFRVVPFISKLLQSRDASSICRHEGAWRTQAGWLAWHNIMYLLLQCKLFYKHILKYLLLI